MSCINIHETALVICYIRVSKHPSTAQCPITCHINSHIHRHQDLKSLYACGTLSCSYLNHILGDTLKVVSHFSR